MAEIPIWPGSSSFAPGDTPFGFYDYDMDFQEDADKVAKFCAQRLGYPIENVELQDIQFYTCFEEAVTTYGNLLYEYKLIDYLLTLEGTETGSTALNDATITPSMANIIRMSEQYATEAGVGGDVNWYSGSIVLSSSVQDYNLDNWATENGISGSDLEIKRVYFNSAPAASEYYYGAPGFGLGVGFGGFLGAYGFTAYNTAYSSLVMPVSYDIAAIQELEMANTVRMSDYSFELINNKLRIFPIPGTTDDGQRMWFQYLLKSERAAASKTDRKGTANNASNVPIHNAIYSQINSVGRQWIFEYTLALVTKTLGNVRNKYSTIPIPGADVTLNGANLVTQGETEANSLLDKLRELFDKLSRRALLERRKDESDFAQSELNKVPMTIFIG